MLPCPAFFPLRALLGLLCLLALSACATRPAPLPGQSQAQVLQTLGSPHGRYSLNGEESWEYNSWPFGQRTFFARFDKEGKMQVFEQVLSHQGFARVQVGVSNKDDVLRLLGKPLETSYLSLPKLEVWTYAYKEADVWDSMMHVHFDQGGHRAHDAKRTG